MRGHGRVHGVPYEMYSARACPFYHVCPRFTLAYCNWGFRGFSVHAVRKEGWICEARILEFLAMQLDFCASHPKFLEPEDKVSICVLDCRRRFNLMYIRAHARESHLETSQAVCQRYAWPIWRSALGHGKAATRLLELRDWSGAVPLFAWLLQRYRMGRRLIRKQQPEAEVKGLGPWVGFRECSYTEGLQSMRF